ncbi:hypothetical protein [Nocardioides bruguierae]|uniref:Uncharacterized protein n=1 Tax=Nocardioides bruguierae TaxID=2945102 RepID=A0A9X2DBL7_9ACTN|nr:hypothetical protein [Nocardioides bruguierae]MCM0622833.1 hypothetical protein [Nocardioides bruguierae]
MTNHGLRLGGLDLVGETAMFYEVKVLGSDSGTDWGSPQPVNTVLSTLMLDGAVIITDSWDPREVVLGLSLKGIDGLALAQAEAALASEIGKVNVLEWTPPNGAPTAIFDVITSSFTHEFDDLLEEMHGERIMAVSLTCHPFPRSTTNFEVEAITSATVPSSTVISDGSTTTGWTARGALSTNGTDTVISGAVSSGSNWLEYDGDLSSLADEPYLTTTVSWLHGYTPDVTLTADGVAAEAVQISGVYLSGPFLNVVYTWLVESAPSTVRITVTNSGEIRVKGLTSSNQEPTAASLHQKVRYFEVPGSARTEAAIAVQDDTDALGEVLVYTWADNESSGWAPLLSPHRTSGGTLVSSPPPLVAANGYGLGAELILEPPARMPAGTYALLARLWGAAGSHTLTWSARVYINGNGVGPIQGGDVTVDLADTDPHIVPVDAGITLPPMKLPSGSEAVVRFSFEGSGLSFDEAWIFNTTIGDLTWVDCGDDTPAAGADSNRLWIEPATVADPTPSVFIGTAEDRADGRVPGAQRLKALGRHRFPPGKVSVLTVTPGTETALATLTGPQRWFGPPAA